MSTERRAGRRWLPARLFLLSSFAFAVSLAFVRASLRLSLGPIPPLIVQWGMPDDAVEQRAGLASRESYGTLTFDQNGFRVGSGLPYDQSILFLGDSFTEGH